MAGALLYGCEVKLVRLSLCTRSQVFTPCWRAYFYFGERDWIYGPDFMVGSIQPRHRPENARLEMMAACIERMRFAQQGIYRDETAGDLGLDPDRWRKYECEFAMAYTLIRHATFPDNPVGEIQ
jgi:hypothetical protein